MIADVWICAVFLRICGQEKYIGKTCERLALTLVYCFNPKRSNTHIFHFFLINCKHITIYFNPLRYCLKYRKIVILPYIGPALRGIISGRLFHRVSYGLLPHPLSWSIVVSCRVWQTQERAACRVGEPSCIAENAPGHVPLQAMEFLL